MRPLLLALALTACTSPPPPGSLSAAITFPLGAPLPYTLTIPEMSAGDTLINVFGTVNDMCFRSTPVMAYVSSGVLIPIEPCDSGFRQDWSATSVQWRCHATIGGATRLVFPNVHQAQAGNDGFPANGRDHDGSDDCSGADQGAWNDEWAEALGINAADVGARELGIGGHAYGSSVSVSLATDGGLAVGIATGDAHAIGATAPAGWETVFSRVSGPSGIVVFTRMLDHGAHTVTVATPDNTSWDLQVAVYPVGPPRDLSVVLDLAPPPDLMHPDLLAPDLAAPDLLRPGCVWQCL